MLNSHGILIWFLSIALISSTNYISERDVDLLDLKQYWIGLITSYLLMKFYNISLLYAYNFLRFFFKLWQKWDRSVICKHTHLSPGLNNGTTLALFISPSRRLSCVMVQVGTENLKDSQELVRLGYVWFWSSQFSSNHWCRAYHWMNQRMKWRASGFNGVWTTSCVFRSLTLCYQYILYRYKCCGTKLSSNCLIYPDDILCLIHNPSMSNIWFPSTGAPCPGSRSKRHRLRRTYVLQTGNIRSVSYTVGTRPLSLEMLLV